jgi:hypothetical protein
MKKPTMICIIGLAMILCGNAFATSLFFDPSASVLYLNEIATINVWISGLGDGVAPNLGAFDLGITYDASLLALQSFSFSNYLGYPTDSFTFGSIGSGLLSVQEVSFLPDAALASLQPSAFSLLSMDFRTIGLGIGLISFQKADLSDGLGLSLSAELRQALVNVAQAPTPVPEPATWLLVSAGGLMGMGYMKRKR